MGTSGQNVTDILKNSSLEHSLDAMQKTLEWKHLCPTVIHFHYYYFIRIYTFSFLCSWCSIMFD